MYGCSQSYRLVFVNEDLHHLVEGGLCDIQILSTAHHKHNTGACLHCLQMELYNGRYQSKLTKQVNINTKFMISRDTHMAKDYSLVHRRMVPSSHQHKRVVILRVLALTDNYTHNLAKLVSNLLHKLDS